MHPEQLKMDNDKNYKDKDCSTQRDILKEGIRQSKEIGNFVISNNIEIDKVISSPTCRTYKTAKYAGWDYKIDKNLRNTSKKNIQEKRFKKIKKGKYRSRQSFSFSWKKTIYRRFKFNKSWS